MIRTIVLIAMAILSAAAGVGAGWLSMKAIGAIVARFPGDFATAKLVTGFAVSICTAILFVVLYHAMRYIIPRTFGVTPACSRQVCEPS